MVYTKFKEKLINELETKRDMLVIREKHSQLESLFGIKTDEDKLYMNILRSFEIIILQNIENLVEDLCKEKGIKYYRNISNQSYYDLDIEINNTKTSIDFKSNPITIDNVKNVSLAKNIRKTNNPYIIVFLLKEGIESKSITSEFEKKLKAFEEINVECIVFEEFLEKVFGNDEKEKFQNEMINFTEDMHKAIGYQITELCSPYNLDKLKNELKNELCSFDYDLLRKKQSENINSDLNNKNFNIIKETFLNEKRYELLLSDSDFAKSFITSEWLYKKYYSLDELDNTFIVSGYIKSIEQLMWKIIMLVGQGREIKGVFIAKDNQDEIDKTLGALQYFLANWDNDDLFLNSFGSSKHFVMNYLKNQISTWRSQYRNGYFHKHNLDDKEKIEAIRNETYFLYLLILGTVYLKPSQLALLKQ